MNRKVIVATLAASLLLPTGAKAFLPIVGIVISSVATVVTAKFGAEAAKGAVRDILKDVDAKLKERIDQLGDRADQSIRLASEEFSKKLKEAEGIVDRAIDKAEGVIKRAGDVADEFRRKAFADAFRLEKQFFEDLDRQQRSLELRIEAAASGTIDLAAAAAARQTDRVLNQLESLERSAHKIADGLPRFGTPAARPDAFVDVQQGRFLVPKLGGSYVVALRGLAVTNPNEKAEVLVGNAKLPNLFERLAPMRRLLYLPASAVNRLAANGEMKDLEIKIGASVKATATLMPRFAGTYELTVFVPGVMGVVPQKLAVPVDDDAMNLFAEVHGPKDEFERAALLGSFQEQINAGKLLWGTHFVKLPPRCDSYRLTIRWFDGDVAVLTPSSPAAGRWGARTTRDVDGTLRIETGVVNGEVGILDR